MDSGSCHTCQNAIGIMVTSTGLYRACSPENWRNCNALHRSSRRVAENASIVRQTRGRPVRTLLRKTRAVARLVRQSFTR